MKLDGIEVEDADRSLYLHIRKADTLVGKKDPEKCAAAKAACREPGVLRAKVYRTRTYLLMQKPNGKKFWRRFQTPGSIRSELVAFDRGGAFDPGDYIMNPVTKTQRLGAPSVHANRGSGVKKGKRPKPHIVRGIRPLGPSGWNGERQKR